MDDVVAKALAEFVAAEAKRVATIEAYNAELVRQRERGIFPVKVQPEYEAMENARHEFWDTQKHLLKVAALSPATGRAEGAEAPGIVLRTLLPEEAQARADALADARRRERAVALGLLLGGAGHE